MADISRFQPASDQSLMVYFGDRITPDAHRRVRALLHLLQTQPVSGVRNLHPGYCSMLVKFDTLTLTHDDLERTLRSYVARLDAVELPEPRRIEIPVCYGGAFGPDLDELASSHQMSAERAIELHSSGDYLVYFIGFVPGFAYLGGLPEVLATPRLSTPRRAVAPGSVAIGGNQTGVYPVATPGGWRIIGRTPLAMFVPARPDASVLSIGDRVRFVSIARDEFEETARA
jgi:inhibitor of KinA